MSEVPVTKRWRTKQAVGYEALKLRSRTRIISKEGVQVREIEEILLGE